MQEEREPKSVVVCVLHAQSKVRKSLFDPLELFAELGRCFNDGTPSVCTVILYGEIGCSLLDSKAPICYLEIDGICGCSVCTVWAGPQWSHLK